MGIATSEPLVSVADSCTLTCQVLQDSSHVHRCPYSNPVLGVALLDVPQHPPHREDDACLGRPGGLGGLLLPTSARHGGGPGSGSVSTVKARNTLMRVTEDSASPSPQDTLVPYRYKSVSRHHCT